MVIVLVAFRYCFPPHKQKVTGDMILGGDSKVSFKLFLSKYHYHRSENKNIVS